MTGSSGRPVGGGQGNARLRQLDQIAGPAVLRALGWLRTKRPFPMGPRRIGLMKTVGIGDVVLATATVQDIRDTYPEATLVIITGPENASVARLVPGVEVVALPTTRPWAAVPLLRAQRLEVLLDLGQWTRLEAVYAALSRARWTAGFETGDHRRHYAYDASVRHSAEIPELENYQRLAALMAVTPNAQPSFSPSSAPPADLQGCPYVVCHLWPGGFRSELRQWPNASWRELVRRVAAEGCRIVLTGGPLDVPRTEAFIAACGQDGTHVVSAAGRFPMPELVNLLSGARCVVSVNTGVMHMAAACGVPTIALNGPTSSLRWGPVGDNVVCLDSELPGCGFLNLGFEYDGHRFDCMSGISSERVIRAVEEQIA